MLIIVRILLGLATDLAIRTHICNFDIVLEGCLNLPIPFDLIKSTEEPNYHFVGYYRMNFAVQHQVVHVTV